MQKIPAYDSEIRGEQIRNATAINLIFNSGLNVLKFYKLRHLLGTKQGGIEILNQMKEIVNKEIEISTALLPISEKDNRIGYHSEANGYKIFPEKLKWRIQTLKELLQTEFVEVENRLNNGQIPLDFYFGLNQNSTRRVIANSKDNAEWNYFYLENGEIDKNTALRVFEDENGCHVQIKVDSIEDSIRIKPEFNLMFPKIPLNIIDGKFVIQPSSAYSVPTYKVKAETSKFKFNCEKVDGEYVYTISFTRNKMRMTSNETFRLGVWRSGKVNSTLLHANNYFISQLIRGEFSPEYFCFFVKE